MDDTRDTVVAKGRTGVKESRPAPSLKARRNAVLTRRGLGDKSRSTMDKPTTTFYLVIALTIGMVLLGLLMVFSSSSVNDLHAGGSAWATFVQQLTWVGVGTVAMWTAYRFPYDRLKGPVLQTITLAVVAVNLIVILKGEITNGAKAWLSVGWVKLQPSEFLKLAMILFFANFISGRHRGVKVGKVVMWPMFATVGIACAILALQGDYGGALIFIGIGLIMMFMASIPVGQLAMGTGMMVLLGAMVLTRASRASRRLLAFLDLEGNKTDLGYQVYQALLSIANGGMKGTGIGAGTGKWGYVPLAYSDFIFSVVAEELGLFGVTAVIGGFAFFVVLSIQIAVHAKDLQGAFIAGGIGAWFGFQAIVNIGGVVGIMPMTGLTLPFLSYGGSSMIASLTAVGLLLNVARYTKRK